MTRTAAFLLPFAFAAACLPVAAQQQQMKPGLWEINTKAGGPQGDKATAEMRKRMANLPPEQRKQMEAMMASHGVRILDDGSMSVQVCMTKEMVERNAVPERPGCTFTREQRSADTMKLAFSCAKPPSSGEGEVRFAPETYESHMTVRTGTEGKEQTMSADGTGKWLGTDCGEIKPVAVK